MRKFSVTFIADEKPEFAPSIAALHRAAFDGDVEAELVARLHRDKLVVLSLVTIRSGEVVGHVLFSELAVEIDGRKIRAVSLAPLAVRPDRQRSGIGTRLVEESLPRLRAVGWEAVIVVGHPAYYARFGFSVELARKLASPYAGEAFMALELVPGALAGRAGAVRYPAAFDES
jgi:putative acetyltransferase